MQINFFQFSNFLMFKQVCVQSIGMKYWHRMQTLRGCVPVCSVWLRGCLPRTVFQELPNVPFLLVSTHLATSCLSQAILGRGASQLAPLATGSYQEWVRLSFHCLWSSFPHLSAARVVLSWKCPNWLVTRGSPKAPQRISAQSGRKQGNFHSLLLPTRAGYFCLFSPKVLRFLCFDCFLGQIRFSCHLKKLTGFGDVKRFFSSLKSCDLMWCSFYYSDFCDLCCEDLTWSLVSCCT